MQNMIDNFTNKYSLTKTLRFSLIPQGKTEENFDQKILQQDVEKSEAYPRVKEYIDEYHRSFIEKVLVNVSVSDLNEYAQMYFMKNKDDKQKLAQTKLEEKMRKEIANALSKHDGFKLLSDSKLVEVELKKLAKNENELNDLQVFNKFTTYFAGFNQNRANMYSSEDKPTAISYRIINENLPKFLDNTIAFKKVLEAFPEYEWAAMNSDFSLLYKLDIRDIFSVDYFNFTLSQSGIDLYNNVLGGFTQENGIKIQGLNERINLFCQKNNGVKLPQMKMLFKQILSKSDKLSFVLEKYENDAQIISSLGEFFTVKFDDKHNYLSILNETTKLFNALKDFDSDKIYVKNDMNLTTVSQKVFGSWSCVQNAINAQYDEKNIKKSIKDFEKYADNRRKALKKIESYSLNQIQTYGQDSLGENFDGQNVLASLYAQIETLNDEVSKNFELAKSLIFSEYPSDKNLISDENSIGIIKNLLDSIKQFQSFALLLTGSKKESEKDLEFYGKYDELLGFINEINHLYDKVRNYLTQKPYSKDKMKLNFGSPTLLNGWDKNKEENNLSVILRNGNKYFLAIMDKKNNKIFRDLPKDTVESQAYEKMWFKQVANPAKDIQNLMVINGVTKRVTGRKIADGSNPRLEESKDTYLPQKINQIRKNKSHMTTNPYFSKDDLMAFIDYYKDRICEYKKDDFSFVFKPSNQYSSFNEFTDDVNMQAYRLTFSKVSSKYIDDLVSNDKLYLFQIYCKDFSENKKSQGTPNLHTMYFKALFDQVNLNNVVYGLNGGAEIFYRQASIKPKDIITHKANEAIKNKNQLNPKATSTFDYELIKDKRFTKRQFALHLPITMNFKASGNPDINVSVMKAIKQKEDQYIIGIDRGERHLIYVSVINGKGEIVEQYSLNEIVNERNGIEHRVDYHELLNKREKDRLDARKNWKSVENIKELKEGYISQVVHKICLLVQKYDAIIAMEDLNSGFKNSRIKVEKQTYQKFEKMLIDKLNYYVDKSKSEDEMGGLYHAYQLTNKFESFKKMGKQNGVIYYIPAWLTSKIDPTTGFVDLLKPKYTSMPNTKEFINSFDCIKYNKKENHFEFVINYNNFPRANADYLKNWTICTNAERLENFRNQDKNSEWDTKTVNLTKEFITLFEKNNINYESENLIDVLTTPTTASFYKSFIHLLKLTLQMRNSQTGTEIDYLISPVKNQTGKFYDSRNFDGTSIVPNNADANGAFHIALKAKWVVEQIKVADFSKPKPVKLAISNQEWLEFAQDRNW